MPCLLALVALAFPRLVMIMLVIFSDYIGRAYDTTMIPLVGFFLMPYTTLAYAWAINENGSVSGIHFVVVVIGVLFDLGSAGSGAHSGAKKRTRE